MNFKVALIASSAAGRNEKIQPSTTIHVGVRGVCGSSSMSTILK